MKVLADGPTTGGRYDLFECLGFPGTTLPWLRHTAYDVQLFVLEGELTVHTEARSVVMTAGQNWLIQRGVAHAISSSGSETAHSMVVASPSGMAHVVRAVGIHAEVGSLPPTVGLNQLVLSQALAEVGDELVLTGTSANAPAGLTRSHQADHWNDSALQYLREELHEFA